MRKMCQNVKNLAGGPQKITLDITRFTYDEVNFDVTYEIHQNWSKILSIDILRVFEDHHM